MAQGISETIGLDVGDRYSRYSVVDQTSGEEVVSGRLRTTPGGHPDYRRVCQQMHRQIADVAGHRLIADAMSFVDHEDYELARLQGERRAAAKRAALGIADPG